MIDFKNLKKLTIGGVELKQLFINGVQVWKAVSYTNQIPISTDKSGAIYNGKGFKENTWVNAGNEGSVSGKNCTGFIPCKIGDVIRLKNIGFDNDSNNRLSFFKSDKSYIGQANGNSTWYLNSVFKGEKGSDGYYNKLTLADNAISTGCAFIRVSCNNIDSSSIITVNQEITD